ncbi:MAG TPA: response regulator [Polyangiaceae bacterium]|nr:response regulator [Polyangiaceae bacterium]
MTTTLLAVDDSKTIRRVLEITFAGENYRTVLAESADDALNKLRAERPSVALVDASLGASSGYDLCQQIKREAPGVTVIVLASKQAPYDRARGSSVGADDFIDKPFDTQQLIDKVNSAARRTGDVAARPSTGAQPVPAAASTFARPRTTTLAYGTGSTEPVAPATAQSTSVGLGQRSPAFSGPTPTQPSLAGAAQTASAYGARGGPASLTQPFGSQGSVSQPAPAFGGGTQGGFPSPRAAIEAAPVPAAVPAAAQPRAASAPGPAVAGATAVDGQFAQRLAGLGLTNEQVQGVLALSRDVVEKVVWEVVPVLAETLIKEEIRRLTSD